MKEKSNFNEERIKMKVKLERYSDFCARKVLPSKTIPNTSDWRMASNALLELVEENRYNSMVTDSLVKTIRYLKRHMTGEAK
jgi:hypothetical protein